MQYYLNGFTGGDPLNQASGKISPSIPELVDVLVVGAGPAGAVLTAQLAQFKHLSTCVVEKNEQPLVMGHADGVACRTVEMFNAFGLADRLIREGYSVNETVFWGPDPQDQNSITRTSRVKDVAEGLSEYPHLIVNQARLQNFLFEKAAQSVNPTAPQYGIELLNLVDTGHGSHPLTAHLRQVETGQEFTISAKYVVGTDGARSQVRKSMGIRLAGDTRNHAWGVMDMLVTTSFPDIRFKAAIQSADGGNILLIPREGGYMVRLYVDLGDLDPSDRNARQRFTAQEIIEKARKILSPYTLDVKEIVWWSVYEVGQRLAGRFDNAGPTDLREEPNIFIAGDACHTHSAKAGQGMNVSMQDAFNLGWKLSAVLQGHSPASLLRTYSEERQRIAQELIDFDIQWSATMSASPKDPKHPEAGGLDAAEIQERFVQGGRFTAGFGTRYAPSTLIGASEYQHLATGFAVGERFYSATVTRIADALQVGLGHTAEADGRWRIYAFADQSTEKFQRLMEYLEFDPASPIRQFTGPGQDIDSVFDVRGVLQGAHTAVPVTALPSLLRPSKGIYGLTDYEKAFASALKDCGREIFEERGVDREQGVMVVVRPDQYIAQVLPLDATEMLPAFFEPIMKSSNASLAR
ncbi:FAD-dependent monooxygenase [Glutamicibacter sp.]|uniref:FAD-dependent monooxygenase n=1 Tax=Glutamicibacter sp. TaxID=1931995 RepID=UPI0028BE7056|nr:FAD-dependent monooxygenase [Glutamicibacter sp.]